MTPKADWRVEAMKELDSLKEMGALEEHINLQDKSLATFLSKLSLLELFNYSKDINDAALCKSLLFNFYCCSLSCNVKLDEEDFIFELNSYLNMLSEKDIDALLDAKDKYLAQKKQDDDNAMHDKLASNIF